uniref:Putative salivary lipocalin n=1 Tax=Rhipicephalus pulchellus TaxID=72859 RepID=L7LSW8_RHIPC
MITTLSFLAFRMRMMVMRNFRVIFITMLLTAVVARAQGSDHDSDLDELNKEAEQVKKPDQTETVDIAKFYKTDEVIWIFSATGSHFPCIVDIVEKTSDDTTTFWRYHNENTQFQKRFLNGRFLKEPSGLPPYDTMVVSPSKYLPNRVHRSWKGTEKMLHESSDKNCAFFEVTYNERPDRRSLPDQKTALFGGRPRGSMESTVEYDLRIKNSIMRKDQVPACLEKLRAAMRQSRYENLELPTPLFQCKEYCQNDPQCGDALSGQQANTPPAK